MATYVFRCPDCSVFEVVQPMSSLTPTHACPTCGAESSRVYTPPGLTTTSRAFHRAMDTAQASAEQPQVVHAIPAGAPRPRSGRHWSPATGAPPVNAARRPSGPYQALPRL